MSQPDHLPMPAPGQPVAATGHPIAGQPAPTMPGAPAGWHPDPAGAPLLRYHDGMQWTAHTTPATPPQYHTPPPVAAPAQAVAVAVNTGAGPNHALHAVLTLFTCGAWLPVWILIAIFGRR
jgi:Protein of unknown function (DUF2510)